MSAANANPNREVPVTTVELPAGHAVDWDSPKVFVTSINKSLSYQDFVAALFKPLDTEAMELMHAALGVAGEAGELADAIKKHVIYGKPVDRKNIIEELGDLRFYMQALMNHYDIGEIDVVQGNAHKLAKRYPTGGYRDEDAIVRADKVEPIYAEVCFRHDLEDGWYVVKNPISLKDIERNHWKDMKILLTENNWIPIWVGNVYYKPEDVTEVKPETVSDMFAPVIMSPTQVGVGISTFDTHPVELDPTDPRDGQLPWGLSHGQLGNDG